MSEPVTHVRLLIDARYPAAWVTSWPAIPAGTIVPVLPATNIPQDSPKAIRYWIDTDELKDDAYGIGICDGEFAPATDTEIEQYNFDHHDHAAEGCTYLGLDMWDCGHTDNLPFDDGESDSRPPRDDRERFGDMDSPSHSSPWEPYD